MKWNFLYQITASSRLGGYRSQIPVLSVLCPQLDLLNPPPKKKNCWVHHWTHLKTVINQKVRSTCPQNKQGPQQLPCILMLKSCAMIIKLKCFWSHLVDYTKSACIGTWKHSYWATTPARGQNMPWTWSSHYLFHSTVVKNILKTVLLLTCNNIITWV